MRHIRHNFTENYHAFTGSDREKILADEFAKLLVMEPDQIARIFTANNIVVPNAKPKTLINLLQEHNGNSKIMAQISGLLLALNSGFEGGSHPFLGIGKGKDKTAEGAGAGSSFFQNLGTFIKDNKTEISDTVGGLRDLFGKKNQVEGLKETVVHYQTINVPTLGGQGTSINKMPVWGWVAIGVGALALIGGMIFVARR